MLEIATSGLLTGHPAELAGQFAGLLWGDLMVSLLLGVAERPNPRESTGRARDAAAACTELSHRLRRGVEGMGVARRVHSPPFQGGVAAPLIKDPLP